MRSRAPFPSIRRIGLVLAAACALLGASGPQTCAPSANVYMLLPESTLARGCFDPCLCPILLSEGLRGWFLLTEDTRAPGSPFREFEVKDVRWWVTLGGAAVPITGSGRYRVGGEVALTQQLELDLQVGKDPVQHFDSGLVVGGRDFPAIDVRISVNRAFCYDTVIDVVAQPLVKTL